MKLNYFLTNQKYFTFNLKVLILNKNELVTPIKLFSVHQTYILSYPVAFKT